MVEHALQEAALAAEAALAGEAARAAHMEGVTAAQEEEGMAWIANAMAAAEHEFAHARPRLPVRIDTGRDVVLSNEAPPVEPRPFANGTPVVLAADFKGAAEDDFCRFRTRVEGNRENGGHEVSTEHCCIVNIGLTR